MKMFAQLVYRTKRIVVFKRILLLKKLELIIIYMYLCVVNVMYLSKEGIYTQVLSIVVNTDGYIYLIFIDL